MTRTKNTFRLIKNSLERASIHSNFWKSFFKINKISIDKIKTLEDYKKLPIINKKTVLKHGIFSFGSSKPSDIATICGTGGTTGTPFLVPYNKNLWKYFTRVTGKIYVSMKLSKKDRVAILYNLGLAPTARIHLQGLSNYGTCAIPIGTTLPQDVILDLFKKLKITSFFTASGFALSLTSTADSLGINPKKYFGINKIFCSAMPLSEQTREYLQKKWGAEVFQGAGATEGFFIGYECQQHNGMHIVPEMVFIEIVDPITGKEGDINEEGEAIITTLLNDAMYLFRYRLGDLIKISMDSCKCGNKTPRIWIVGRTEGTLFLSTGQKIVDFQVRKCTEDIKGITGNYQMKLDIEKGKDIIKFKFETTPKYNSKKLAELLKDRIFNIYPGFRERVNKDLINFNIELIPLGKLSANGSKHKIIL